MSSTPPLGLADGMRRAGLDYAELWQRYLAVGGAASLEDLRAHVDGDRCADDREHNIIAQAINDAFVEQGLDHPVGYEHLDLPEQTPHTGPV